MEQTIKIEVPDGYELQWNNNHTEVKVVKKKELTYKNICQKIFSKLCYFTDRNGCINYIYSKEVDTSFLNCAISKEQLQKMLAYNKLMNIAEYLNEGWKPDWNNGIEYKYYISFVTSYSKYIIHICTTENRGVVYFKSKELAEQAMQIIGEDLDILFKN